MYKLDLEKAEEPEIKLPIFVGSERKTSKLQKNTYCFTDYLEASDCVDHKKWKILKELGILDNLTFPLRNLCMGQEATVRTGHGTTDWFQTGKGVHQGHIMSYCVFNFYAEHIV